MRGAASSVVPQHACWRVLCSDSGTRAATYGRTYGRSVVMVAAFRRSLCFRSDATGAGKQRQFGFISVPPSHYAGHGTCKERADRGWPKARWALRHSGQISSSAWTTIQGGLKSVRVEGLRCPGAPSAALPLLLWWAALEGDSRILWLWHHGGNGDGVVGAGGDAD